MYSSTCKCAPVVFLWKFGLKGLLFSKMESSCEAIFCKSHRYSKRGENALLRQVIIIIVNFTRLWDIDNRKRMSEWGASYVIHFLFLLGYPLLFFFSRATNLFILPKTSHPVDFLVVWDDWTTASRENDCTMPLGCIFCIFCGSE